jgi:hypothetical protein
MHNTEFDINTFDNINIGGYRKDKKVYLKFSLKSGIKTKAGVALVLNV